MYNRIVELLLTINATYEEAIREYYNNKEEK